MARAARDPRLCRVWTDPRLLGWSLGQILLAPGLLTMKLARYAKRRYPSEISPARWFLPSLTPEVVASETALPGPRVVLVAQSLGELMTTERLAAALREARPDVRLVYCVRDPKTLAHVRQTRPGLNLVTWPFDALPPVTRWLRQTRPDLVVFTERFRFPLWSLAAARYGARVALVNGRCRRRDSGWRDSLYRWQFGAFSALLMQRSTDEEAVRPHAAPGCDVRWAGDLKPTQRPPESSPELHAWLGPEAGAPLVAAGSVDTVEEARMTLDAFRRARARVPCRLLLAPRRTNDFPAVAALVHAEGFTLSRRSRHEPPADVHLLDTLGELATAYRACAAAYVGGAYHPGGAGHNIVEPLLWGVPVAYGVSRGHFEAVQTRCEAHGVGTRIDGADTLADFFVRFLCDSDDRSWVDEAARGMIAESQGALTLTVAALLRLLPEGQTGGVPLHPDVMALTLSMRRLQAYLATHDEARWAQLVGQCADWAENSDAAGLDRFLGLFGGMGSLTDLVLHRDGKPLTTENEELNRLLDEAWILADRLRDERRHVAH